MLKQLLKISLDRLLARTESEYQTHAIAKISDQYAIPRLQHIAYTEEDWRETCFISEKIPFNPCPNCGNLISSGGAYSLERKYRACKMCGMWQEVNGKPYFAKLRGHICGGYIKAQFYLPWEELKICPKCKKRDIEIETVWQQLVNFVS